MTRERLYIDALQELYADSSKVMVDVESGNNMMYLPLDKLANQRNVSRTIREQDVDIRQLTDRVVEQLRRDSQSSRREGR